MPLYDYKCEAGHKYELREPFGSPAHHPCQKCGKPAHRVLHARPIMFKGSGWYSTDSRDSSSTRRGATSSSSSSSDSGSSGGDGKSESKSESKGSSKRSESRAEANDSAAKKSDSSSSKKAPSTSD